MAPRLPPSRETSRRTRTDGATSASTADAMEECDRSSGPNEVGLNGKPVESSTIIVSPTLGTKDTTTKESHDHLPTNRSSEKDACHESFGGEVYGTSPSGTGGASSGIAPTTELWVICPQHISSALHKAFKANNIGATDLFISTIQDHEPYQWYIELIKKQRANLII